MLTEDEARNITTELAQEKAKLNVDMTQLNTMRTMIFDHYNPAEGEALKAALRSAKTLSDNVYSEIRVILALLEEQASMLPEGNN